MLHKDAALKIILQNKKLGLSNMYKTKRLYFD